MSRMCTRLPFLLVIAGLAVTAFAQNQPAVNPSAVFKTMVGYQGAAIAGIRGARPVREGIPAAPTIFSGSRSLHAPGGSAFGAEEPLALLSHRRANDAQHCR